MVVVDFVKDGEVHRTEIYPFKDENILAMFCSERGRKLLNELYGLIDAEVLQVCLIHQVEEAKDVQRS